MLRLVNIHAVFVVEGEHLLTDHRDDAPVPVIQLKIQSNDIALQLPAQSDDVGHILDQMQELVGKLELQSVCHSDEVPLMDGEDFPLDMGHLVSGSIRDIRLVPQGEKLRGGLIHDLIPFIRNLDFVVQREDYVEELIQVTWDMADEDTRKREIEGIKEAAKGTKCDKLTIVTRERKETIEEDGFRIEVVGIEEWLSPR